MSNENLIRLPVVKQRTGYGGAWIYRLMRQGRFPKPIKIGSRSVAWVESEINAWVKQRIVDTRGNNTTQ